MIASARHEQVRGRAFDDLRRYEVVMEGHFDYGNGFHGNLYLNPHHRPMTQAPYLFAPFGDTDGAPTLSPFYASRMKGKRVLIVDDVRNTGTTFKRCADLVKAAGACVSLDVPNVSLVEYKAPPNYAASACPMCAAHVPITAF